ncbi:hypothetical protein [Pantanalinema sp. GBBB05]|uniref:hypothetical protein n=1 Tax=Pantanalinema sp. GBBB05 TaxID=2604139 RepID=UPI001DA1D5C4|nr:hypothetical protein [Pantanalinema sp. GBBB05]
MVGTVEQIEQDLAAIDKLIAELAEEFHQAYSSYLTVLGQAARQQLILASYHVCTQGYPTQFLDLSFSQRQQLQQQIRQLANQLQEDLLAQLYPPTPIELLDEQESSAATSHSANLDPLTELLTPTEALPVEPSSEPPIEAEAKLPRSLTPTDLAHWREALEQSIAEELRTVSHAVNRLLQQAGVLPKQLPEPVLQAASKAEMSDVAPHSPNLLNVLIASANDSAIEEDGEEPPSPSPSVVHIVAIHLRLSDIEFANTPVTAARTRLRNFSARLKTIGREYYKKQQERAIAQAQDAWRASWFEE